MSADEKLTRTCPGCGEEVWWCELTTCHLYTVMGSFHWSHYTVGAAMACPNLGDVNTDPAAELDNVRTRGLL